MSKSLETLIEEYNEAKRKQEASTKKLIDEVNKRLEGKDVHIQIQSERGLDHLEKTEEGIIFHYTIKDYMDSDPATVVLEEKDI